MSVPLHPKRHLVPPRKWGAEPERRMSEHMIYRRSRYGQGQPVESTMLRNMRQQQLHRRTTVEGGA